MDKIFFHIVVNPQIRNPTKSLRALRAKSPRMRFLLFGQAFYTKCWLICEHNAPLPPSEVTFILTTTFRPKMFIQFSFIPKEISMR